jgi:hypothetical protein
VSKLGCGVGIGGNARAGQTGIVMCGCMQSNHPESRRGKKEATPPPMATQPRPHLHGITQKTQRSEGYVKKIAHLALSWKMVSIAPWLDIGGNWFLYTLRLGLFSVQNSRSFACLLRLIN